MMIGLYWGRFNPPHKGHVRIIKKLLAEVDRLIIVIGASQIKNTKKNPFSAQERKMMMEAYLNEEEIDTKRIKVMPLPDEKTYSLSVKSLIKNCPRFDVLYLSYEKEPMSRIIEDEIRIKKFKRSGDVSSTSIRNAIATNKRWKHLTGKSVAKIIEEINGIERIKKLYK